MRSMQRLEAAARRVKQRTTRYIDVTIIYTDTVCKCIIDLHGRSLERLCSTLEEAEAYYKSVAARHSITELTVLMIPDNGRDNEAE